MSGRCSLTTTGPYVHPLPDGGIGPRCDVGSRRGNTSSLKTDPDQECGDRCPGVGTDVGVGKDEDGGGRGRGWVRRGVVKTGADEDGELG